jgi:hypothetical protein
MGRHVCQHDEARGQPQPPDHAIRPCSCVKLRTSPCSPAIASPVSNEGCPPSPEQYQLLTRKEMILTRSKRAASLNVLNDWTVCNGSMMENLATFDSSGSR